MKSSLRPMLLSGIDRNGKTFLLVLATLAILVLLLNAAVPALRRCTFPPIPSGLLGKYMCYAMLAMAVDLIWGYCGILSLGHSAFFALGGYAIGMYLMREIGTRGVYADPVLPDFMVFLNWKALPWFWHGFNHFWFAAAMVMFVPGLLALVFGWLAFRSRVTGVYLSIITQALTYALMLAFFRNDMGFGGNNGFTDFKDILGFDLTRDATHLTLFVITAVMLGLAYVVCSYYRRLTRRSGDPGGARCRKPCALHWFSRCILQAVGLRVLRGARRHRRQPLRTAGRNHQPRRVLAVEFH